jgi:cysteine desulfurase
MKRIYLDHAAATPVHPEVMEAMLPYFAQRFGNPSAVYDLGSEIKEVLEEQRAKVARLLNAEPEEIIFTSSGAEANNLAVKGVALANLKKGRHLIVSAIEHHSVLNSARYLEKFHDFEVTFLPVDRHGLVEAARLRRSLTPATVMVSIGHASNEIGTVQPLAELAENCRDEGIFFHTDAVATAGNLPVDVKALNVDLLTISGAALGAPKGVGALFFRRRLRLVPQIHGGIQENGRRGGARHLTRLRDSLVTGITQGVTEVIPTGHPQRRLPGHASFCIEGIEGEALVFMLTRQGIYANTGSACASKALKTSPVLCAIGIRPDLAQGSIVFTMGDETRETDINAVLEHLPPAVKKLRSFSPVWRKRMAAGAGV